MSFEMGVTPEKSSTVEKIENEVRTILIKAGHMDANEDLPRTIENQIRDGSFNLEGFQFVCREIESARYVQSKRRAMLYDRLMHPAIDYRLRNLSKLDIHGPYLTEADLRKFNFDGSNLTDGVFSKCDFSGASFKKTEIGGCTFHNSALYAADLSTILIQGKELNLLEGELRLRGRSMWNLDKTIPSVGTCADCEFYNRAILDISSRRDLQEGGRIGEWKHRAVLLFQEGHPLGYMKLKGDPSFLAMRTIKNEQGEVIFWKGMVYALDPKLETFLEDETFNFRDETEWRKMDMEVVSEVMQEHDILFARNNMRFVRDTNIFDALSVLNENLERGKETYIEIDPR